jgi:hypothetical protein
MSSGPRRRVGRCRESRRRPPPTLGAPSKGRRSTRWRGAPPVAVLGPRGGRAGCGDRPPARSGTPRCGCPWPASHRPAAAGPLARPPLGRHLPRLLAVARPGARGDPRNAEPVRRLDRPPSPAAEPWPRSIGRPGGRPRPVFYVTASVLLWPWVALLFGGAISHLSYLYFAALPPALAVALVLDRGALSRPGETWWWRPTRRTAAWEAGSLAWLTAAGALISSTPASVALVAAAVAGPSTREPPRPSRPARAR